LKAPALSAASRFPEPLVVVVRVDGCRTRS
jgi:hypothetical protein